MTKHHILPGRSARRGGIVFDPPPRRWPAVLTACGVTLAIFAWWRFGSDEPLKPMPAAGPTVGQQQAFGPSLQSIDVGMPTASLRVPPPAHDPARQVPAGPLAARQAPVVDRHDPLDHVATLGVPFESVPPEVAAALSRPLSTETVPLLEGVGSDPLLQR